MSAPCGVRVGSTEDVEQLLDLYELCYSWPLSAYARSATLDLLERGGLFVATSPDDASIIIGMAADIPVEISMPAGFRRAALQRVHGVTWAAVHPVWTRRGVMTALLAAIAENPVSEGVVWAALTASETTIYGRLGYGVAANSWDITTARGAIGVPDGASDVDISLVGVAEGITIHRDVWTAAAAVTPGVVVLPEQSMRAMMGDTGDGQIVNAQRRFVVARRHGKAVAACLLRRAYAGTERENIARQSVTHLVSTDDAARVGLAQFISSMDFARTTSWSMLGADDPVMWAAGGPRAASATVNDCLWLRPLNLCAALESLHWRQPVEEIVELSDPFPGTVRRAHVVSAPDGTVVANETDVAATVELSSATLGMVALGAATPGAMMHRGQYVSHEAGSFLRLMTALQGLHSPCPTIYF